MPRAVKIAVAAGALGLAYWLTLPPTDLSLDSACAPSDIQAQLSEFIYGASFWRVQMDAADRELALLQQVTVSADKTDQDLKGTMSSIESKMTRLSTGASSGTPEEQAEVRAREQRERFARMGHLTVCRAAIERRLG